MVVAFENTVVFDTNKNVYKMCSLRQKDFNPESPV